MPFLDLKNQWRIWFAKPGTQVLGGCRNRLRLIEHLSRSNHTIRLLTNYSLMSPEDQRGLAEFLNEMRGLFEGRFIHIDIQELQIDASVKDYATQKFLLDYVLGLLKTFHSHPVVASDIVRILDPVVSVAPYYDFDSIYELFRLERLPDGIEVSEASIANGFYLRTTNYKGTVNNDLIFFNDPNHGILQNYRKRIQADIELLTTSRNPQGAIETSIYTIVNTTGPMPFARAIEDSLPNNHEHMAEKEQLFSISDLVELIFYHLMKHEHPINHEHEEPAFFNGERFKSMNQCKNDCSWSEGEEAAKYNNFAKDAAQLEKAALTIQRLFRERCRTQAELKRSQRPVV